MKTNFKHNLCNGDIELYFTKRKQQPVGQCNMCKKWIINPKEEIYNKSFQMDAKAKKQPSHH